MIILKDARKKLLEGISKVSDAVGATLGPKGRLAIIERGYGAPEVTKDGVTVAKEIKLPDVWENMGASLIKEAAIKTNDVAGDGTTTATVLTHALCKQAILIMEEDIANPVALKKEIEEAVDQVKTYIREKSVKVSDDVEKIVHVASIAANNNKELGSLIGEAYIAVGPSGFIDMTASENDKSYITDTEGMSFPAGFLSQFFVTDVAKQIVDYENPLILITDRKVDTVQSMTPIAEYAAVNNRPLILVVDEIEPSVMSTIIRNKVSNGIQIAVMKMPGFGDFKKESLLDLAKFTGGNLITADLGRSLDSIVEADFGVCDRFTMSKSSTLFAGGKGDKDAFDEHVESVRKQIPSETTYNEGKFKERLRRLSGRVATVHVGAITESELKEKLYRVEDAINAVKAAVSEGVVQGGGVTLLRAANLFTDKSSIGAQAVRAALYSPFFKILANAGCEPKDYVSDILLNPDTGFDANTLKLGNMWSLGILDTVKGLTIALDAAVSIASTVLTTEVLLDATPHDQNKRSPFEAIPFG